MTEYYMYKVSWFDIATGRALPPECSYAVTGSGSELDQACRGLLDTNVKVREIERQLQETPSEAKADALLSAYAIRYVWLEKVGKMTTSMREKGGWTGMKTLPRAGDTFAGGGPQTTQFPAGLTLLIVALVAVAVTATAMKALR